RHCTPKRRAHGVTHGSEDLRNETGGDVLCDRQDGRWQSHRYPFRAAKYRLRTRSSASCSRVTSPGTPICLARSCSSAAHSFLCGSLTAVIFSAGENLRPLYCFTNKS